MFLKPDARVGTAGASLDALAPRASVVETAPPPPRLSGPSRFQTAHISATTAGIHRTPKRRSAVNRGLMRIHPAAPSPAPPSAEEPEGAAGLEAVLGLVPLPFQHACGGGDTSVAEVGGDMDEL